MTIVTIQRTRTITTIGSLNNDLPPSSYQPQRGPPYLAVMLNLTDSVDGFPSTLHLL
jgi:hypothetical protein